MDQDVTEVSFSPMDAQRLVVKYVRSGWVFSQNAAIRQEDSLNLVVTGMEIVRLLEQHGADIDAVTDCGRSMFMLAAGNVHKDYLEREFIKYTKRKKRVESSNRASSNKNQVTRNNECDVNISSEKFWA